MQFFKGGRRIFNGASTSLAGTWSGIGCKPFADTIFYNGVELLTDICHDVTWQFDGSNRPVEVAFVRFFNQYGKVILTRIYRDGVVVIKHTQQGDGMNAAHLFSIAQSKDYLKMTDGDWVTYKSLDENADIYPMSSDSFKTFGRSDRDMCLPFLEYLDNTLNASNTVAERMGAVVVCSPKNPSNAPMPLTLPEEEKKALEEQISKEYGALKEQKQVMVLPREMSWQVISLATLDLKVIEKVKMAVTAIADRLKVPANQVALIDANSSKTLSNGSELREGDFNKYQSFERLLDCTWVQLARECGLRCGMTETVQGEAVGSYYTIYNKPEQNDSDITGLNGELLGVLSTNEKREALGYGKAPQAQDKTVLATELGVGGTQSLLSIVQSETMTDAEKRASLKILFGLDDAQAYQLIPVI